MKVYVCSHAKIPLRGTEELATVEVADLGLITGHTWRLLQVGYVADSYGLYLHRLIMGPTRTQVVDHKDRNPLNNCRLNLRLASRSQNGANRKADRRSRGTTSDFKGVCWQEDRQRWAAFIHVNGKTHSLGRFLSETDAAVAYNIAALATWGEFALLNDLKEVMPV